MTRMTLSYGVLVKEGKFRKMWPLLQPDRWMVRDDWQKVATFVKKLRGRTGLHDGR